MIRIKGKKIFEFFILGFVILNLSWLLITTIKYNKYVKVVPKNEDGLYVLSKDDGYRYYVKKPNYLHYTGNLTVRNREKRELLVIWPLISGGYKYGFRLQEDGKAFEIYVDENMNPIYKDDIYSAQIFEEHKAKLETLFSKADELWNLK